MKSIFDKLGSGWKAYTGAIMLILYGLLIFVDAAGIMDFPQLQGSYEFAIEMISLGLVGLGLRHKLDQA